MKAWAGKYGARSGLKDFVLSQLRVAYPEPRTTQELCRAVQAEFGVRLLTRKDRQSFVSTVRSLLNIQRRLGVVESLTPPPGDGSLTTWQGRLMTSETLAAQAKNNTEEQFALGSFKDEFMDVVIEAQDAQNNIAEQMLKDERIMGVMQKMLAKMVWKQFQQAAAIGHN